MLADRPIETAGPELDPRLLSQLVALADHRDLGRAAAALSLSSRALVRGIRELERETGEPLLMPATRHAELTPAGERLADGGRRVLRALARFSDAAREEHARVRVAHVADCDTLERVLASAPGLRVRETNVADGEQLCALAEHRLDVALCTDDAPLAAGLAGALIRVDPLMLVGDPAAGVIFTAYGEHWRAHDAAAAALVSSAAGTRWPSSPPRARVASCARSCARPAAARCWCRRACCATARASSPPG